MRNLCSMVCILVIFQSCKKDDPKPGRPGKDKTCNEIGTVAYLPSQCAAGPTGEIGILTANGEYVLITEDHTGKFSQLQVGQKVKFGIDREPNCVVTLACTSPDPDYCGALTCVEAQDEGEEGEKECSRTGTIVFLPSQCGAKASTELGILDENGEYLLVQQDMTGKFSQFQVGQKVRFGYDLKDHCFVTQSCDSPDPDYCIGLTCITPARICGNEGDGQCNETGTIAYIPTQCSSNSAFTTQIGILTSNGEYLIVMEDLTGKFGQYQIGQKVTFGVSKRETCIVTLSCESPDPDYCVTLTCIEADNNGGGKCSTPATVLTEYTTGNYPTGDKLLKISGHVYKLKGGNEIAPILSLPEGAQIMVDYQPLNDCFEPTWEVYPPHEGCITLTCHNADNNNLK